MKRRRSDDAGDVSQRCHRPARRVKVAPGDPCPREQLERRHALQAQVGGAGAGRARPARRRAAPGRGRARGARGTAAPRRRAPPRRAGEQRPRRLPEPAQLGERREGPPVIPGREREKSSIDASSTRSASRHRPRQSGRRRTRRGRTRACTGSRSARQIPRSGHTTPTRARSPAPPSTPSRGSSRPMHPRSAARVALERGRGRLVEPSHPFVDVRAGDERGALQRQAEHRGPARRPPARRWRPVWRARSCARCPPRRLRCTPRRTPASHAPGTRLDSVEKFACPAEPAARDRDRAPWKSSSSHASQLAIRAAAATSPRSR